MLPAGARRGRAGAPAASLVIAVRKPPEACGAHRAECAAENWRTPLTLGGRLPARDVQDLTYPTLPYPS